MVWIHGGGFEIGSAYDQGPQYLMDTENVIIVSVNYRLGPLGFMSLGLPDFTGNNGLKDQALALKWVHENIATFHGRPEEVTLFGESAGSMSAALHILSSQSRGLFSKVILQSKTALDVTYKVKSLQDSDENGQILADKLGCNKTDLACLQALDWQSILKSAKIRPEGLFSGTWIPGLEPKESKDPFLTEEPEILMKSGEFDRNLQVIIGTMKDEGLIALIKPLILPGELAKLKSTYNSTLTAEIFNIQDFNRVKDEDVQKLQEILHFYLGPGHPGDKFSLDNLQALVDMITDSAFLYGTHKTLKYFKAFNVKAFQYIFTYPGQFSITQIFGLKNKFGVSHADDLQYLWQMIGKMIFVTPQCNVSQANFVQ